MIVCGCTKSEPWWIGKWRFDAEATKEYNAKSGKGLGTISRTSLGMIYNQCLDSQTTFTEKEIIHMQNGNGKAKSYSVMEEPSDQQVILKVGTDVSTYTLEGDHMTLTATDLSGESMKFFFRKMN